MDTGKHPPLILLTKETPSLQAESPKGSTCVPGTRPQGSTGSRCLALLPFSQTPGQERSVPPLPSPRLSLGVLLLRAAQHLQSWQRAPRILQMG